MTTFAAALTFLVQLACVMFLVVGCVVGGRVAWDALCDWCGIKDDADDEAAS